MRFCTLLSGSSGNSTFIESGKTRLLVDAGAPASRIAAALESIGVEASSINGILVTHDHIDHVSGVGVCARKLGLPVYANGGTWRAMERTVGKIPPELMRVFETGRDFFIGSLNVLPCPTPHDAAEPVGYVFTGNGHKLTVMTDTGFFGERLLEAAAGSELIMIEANHDIEMLKCGRYPYPLKRRILSDEGHLSNDGCGAALVALYKTGVHRAVLAHLSRDNNIEALALETVRQALTAAMIPEDGFELSVASRSAPGEMLEI